LKWNIKGVYAGFSIVDLSFVRRFRSWLYKNRF